MSYLQGVVAHVTTDEARGWRMALRNIHNLVQDESVSTPPERIQVVVNGPAVRFLLASAPEAAKLSRMLGAGVTISACRNSLTRFGYEVEELTDGVEIVDSGVARVVRAQNHNNHYLKLP